LGNQAAHANIGFVVPFPTSIEHQAQRIDQELGRLHLQQSRDRRHSLGGEVTVRLAAPRIVDCRLGRADRLAAHGQSREPAFYGTPGFPVVIDPGGAHDRQHRHDQERYEGWFAPSYLGETCRRANQALMAAPAVAVG
jgi:hypothetical protein